MSVVKFTAALVAGSRNYTVSTVSSLTVGQLADYLAGQETRLAGTTLELARSVTVQQCLQEINFQAGDRLIVFTQITEEATLRPGEKVVRFRLGTTEIRAAGKTALLIGKADDNQRIYPDFDLRAILTEPYLDYISRRCVQLTFDAQAGVWYAAKVGQTRVLLDDLEMAAQPIALNANHRLRLYRAHDHPAISHPIAEIHLSVEASAVSGSTMLPAGTTPVRILVGEEHEAQTLRASNTLPLGQISTSLIQYFNPTPITDMRLYHMRVLPPSTLVGALRPIDSLYAAVRKRT
ncbi:MAG: hypothetical protein IAE80_05870 [Anaerolinea sp.]|nr:hypothetical protein [Anaerolinea sp.]